MKKVYSNSSDPKIMGWLGGVFVGLALVSYIVYACFMGDEGKNDWIVIFEFLYLFFWCCSWFFIWKSTKCEIDDEAGTIIVPESKKHPMKIADIETITYCQSKKGRLHYLCIHEKGVRFANVRISRKVAEAMVSHLLRLNPDITVKAMNYY